MLILHGFLYNVNILCQSTILILFICVQFIAEATMGTYFGSDCDTDFEKDEMNKYQKSLLLWQFQMNKKYDRSGEFFCIIACLYL